MRLNLQSGKKGLALFIILFITGTLFSHKGFAQNRYWVADVPANWSGDNWANSSNGAADGIGPPAAAENARFDANGTGNCTLDVALDTVTDFILSGYTGTIEFDGNSLRATGSVTLSSGALDDNSGGSSLMIVSTGETTRFSGTAIGVRLEVESDNIDFDGSTFSEVCAFEKTGSGNDDGAGGNVFMDTATFEHSGTGGFWLFGRSSADTFNDFVSMNVSNGGYTYFAYSSDGTRFNGDLEVSCTNSSNGIRFADGDGTASMAAGNTVSIGSAGFSDAEFQLRNFTLEGTEDLNLSLTGTSTVLDIYDCSFGGDVVFSAPRFFTQGTTYGGTANIEKTNASDDSSVGGNYFTGNAVLTNSGSGHLLMGNTSPDTFALNLDFTNSGTYRAYLANNSAGNYIGGDLTIINSASGLSSGYFYVCQNNGSDLTVAGDVVATNSGSSSQCRLFFGQNGSVEVNGDATFTNSAAGDDGYIYMANNSNSTVTIDGVTRVSNSQGSTTKRIYLANDGAAVFGDSLYVTNTSTATNSEVFIAHGSTSTASFLGDIVLEATDNSCDGIYFGNSNGTSTMAAGEAIALSANGFVAENLYIRNFTQAGALATALAPTDVTTLTIYDCSFGGNVSLSSPRISSRGTEYGGDLSFRKTAAENDQSAGGNSVAGTTLFTNLGSGYILWGNGSPDSFAGNVTVLDSSSSNFYLGYNSADNYLNGDLTINKVCSGTNTYTYVSDITGSSVDITGSVVVNMNSTSSNEVVYLADQGTMTIGGDLTITNNSTGDLNQVYLGNNTSSSIMIGGDVSVNHGDGGTTKRTYIGSNGAITIGGRLDVDNNSAVDEAQVLIANSSNASVSITGVCNITNAGAGTTKRVYVGNQGDVALGDSLILTNNSNANNSQLYVQHNSDSENTYAGNIVLESTSSDCDGIFFSNSDGSGTLAAGQTISISDNGFIGQDLYLRNFEQVGATAQILEPTDATVFTIYDCSFGGDATFSAPRITSRGTAYSGNLDFRKTSAEDDASAGGNTVAGTTLFTNLGSGYLLWGNGEPDSFAGSVTVLDSSSRHFYLGHNSAGNYIDGDLNIEKVTTGGATYTYLANLSASTLDITGSLTVNMNSSSSNDRVYVANAGSMNIGGSLTFTNNNSGTNTYIYVADNATSSVTVGGEVDYTTNNSGTLKYLYIGNDGDVDIAGALSMDNNTSISQAQVIVADGSNSAVSIGGVCSVDNDGSGTTRRTYLGNAGSVAFGDSLIIVNSSDATESEVYANHTSTSINTYAGDIVLEGTNNECDGIRFGSSTGQGTLAAGQTISLGTNGYIAKELYLRNFTQIGPTDQVLTPTDTTILTIYDCSFGGNIVFSSPRISSRGTSYAGNLEFRKTNSGNDQSAGGNTVAGTTLFTNIGSGYLMWGNGSPDSFAGNVTVLDSSSNHFYLAYNSADNYLDGDLSVSKVCTGTNTYTILSDQAGSSLEITGSASMDMNSSSSGDRIYVGNTGTIDLGGSLVINNNGSGTSSNIYMADDSASTVTIGGDMTVTTDNNGSQKLTYIGSVGDVAITGNLTIDNSTSITESQFYVANSEDSEVTIGGVCNVENNGSGTTRRVYLGNDGDMTFSDSLIIINSSDANNSQVYLNHNTNGVNSYAADIVLECTSIDCDGVLFGNSGGSGTLAAGQTVSLSSNGFIGQYLYFQNFTQVGPTAQTLHPTVATYFYVNASTWGGDVDFSAPRYFTSNTNYESGATIEKTGDSDDNCSGLNHFTGNATFTNSGNEHFRMGNGNPDTFLLDVTFVNSGEGSMTLANNLGVTYVGGDLNATQAITGTSGNLYLCNGEDATLQVDGSVSVLHSATSTSSGCYIANTGDVTINGDLDVVNSSDANSAQVLIANNTASSISIGGHANLTNSGMNASTTTIYLGNYGDVSVGDSLIISNSSNSSNSLVACNNRDESTASYAGDIVLENSHADGSGISFGQNGGSATLADGQSVSIGANGFVAGILYFYNFDQIGNTAQNVVATGTADMVHSNSDWDGAVVFAAPRMRTHATRFDATASLEKTGASDDNSQGGNYFAGITQLTNSGSGNMQFGTSDADTFLLDLSVDNIGTDHFYLANTSSNNYIGGDLTVNHTTSGTSSVTVFANASSSSLTIDGDMSFTSNSTATSSTFYIANNGDVTIGGSLTGTNTCNSNTAQLYISYEDPSSIYVGGVTNITVTGSGTSSRTYLADEGDAIFQDSVYLQNFSSANTADILCAWEDSSIVQFNGDLYLETTHADGDGIRFGGSGGRSTLADGQRVVIGSGGFVAGNLDFYNFDQVGNTTQSITTTGTSSIYNSSSDWDADLTLIGPRNRSDYSTYNGTLYFEKTGASDDQGAGGNVVDDTATLVNTGSDYMMWGSNAADTFRTELILTNSTTNDGLHLAYNSAGNYVGGSITGINTGSGSSTFISLGGATNSTLTVDGNVSLTNNGTSSTSETYIGNGGDMNIGGNVYINNVCNSNTSNSFIASNSASTVTISGVTTCLNSGSGTTSRIFLGNSGDITFGDSLYLLNSSSASNSQFYLHHGSTSSNTYAGDIVVESSNASCDGVYFGNSNGVGTLAAGQTMTVGPNGFIAGLLYLRNFTQTGPTDQTLALTADATMNIYTSTWGGNVTFSAPRMYTYSSDYEQDAYLEKTGASNDASSGENTIQGNLEMVNSGSGYFLMGNGAADSVMANLTMTNSGTNTMYFAHNTAGNYIGGNFIANNSTTGTSTYMYLSNGSSAELQVDGDVTLNQDASASDPRIHLGNSGDVTINGGLQISNTASGTNSYLYVANNSTSEVSIAGVTTINHATTGGNTHRLYLGSSGDVTLNDSLYLTNSSVATNNELYCNNSSSSNNVYNGPIVLENTNANSEGIFFGNSSGTGTIASGQQIIIGPGGFSSGRLYLGYLTQVGATAQNITLTGTTTRLDYSNSTWNGAVVSSAPQLYCSSTTFNSTADLQKTGATDNASTGGNTFNDDVVFTNSGTGYFMVPNNVADDYNGDVTFVKSSTGLMYPSYSTTSSYAGDLYFDANSAITLGANSGRIVLDGAGAQSINDLAASTEPIFRRLTVDKAADSVTLNMPITVRTDVTFTDGIVITDSINLLSIMDNGTATDASDASFVLGYVEKIGNDAFEFPVGDSIFRPIEISAPSGASSSFRATYIYTNPNPTYQWNAVDAPIDHVSTREYWELDRTNGTSSVNVTLSWDVNSGGVDELDDLLVARWDGDSWSNHGNGGTTGNTTAGTVTSSIAITSFSPFALASSSSSNPLPIELVDFVAYANGNNVELNWATASERDNDFFTLERSSDGSDFHSIAVVQGAGTSTEHLDYHFTDTDPLAGTSYYRLKQTDFDGKFTYSNIETVTFDADQRPEVSITSFDGGLAVSIGNHNNELLDISIYSTNGQLIYQQSLQMKDSFERVIIDSQSIGATGTYMVVVNGTRKQTSQLVFLN